MSVRRSTYGYCIAALVLACSDGGPCVPPPCPEFEAITLTVSSSGNPARPAGVVVVVGGSQQTVPCDVDGGPCHVRGGPGDYRLTISATGFTSQQRQVTVTGDGPGCGTCGHVDRQQIAVILQPAS